MENGEIGIYPAGQARSSWLDMPTLTKGIYLRGAIRGPLNCSIWSVGRWGHHDNLRRLSQGDKLLQAGQPSSQLFPAKAGPFQLSKKEPGAGV